MARIKSVNPFNRLASHKKTTRQGAGKFSKKPTAGGETFHNDIRAGSRPSKSRARRKPYRGQGK